MSDVNTLVSTARDLLEFLGAIVDYETDYLPERAAYFLEAHGSLKVDDCNDAILAAEGDSTEETAHLINVLRLVGTNIQGDRPKPNMRLVLAMHDTLDRAIGVVDQVLEADAEEVVS